MDPLRIHSERYTAAGNQAGTGVQKQLGRPELSQVAILLRESAQNSWDARIDDSIPVVYGVRSWIATPEQREFLKEVIFREWPAGGLDISSSLNKSELRLLTLYDRGTRGLEGPTRANIRPRPGERNNFNNLLRNIGSAEHESLSGGTYGYGKAALYTSSSVNTILVHTVCRQEGEITNRFIGSALGEQYDSNGTPYTGRHWWGVVDDPLSSDAFAEPVTGQHAAEINRSLGMRPFESKETGTSILIVDPEFATSETPTAIQNVLLWNFWPKMIDHDGRPAMRFGFEWDGEQIEIPHPRDVRYLRPFVESLEAVREREKRPGYTRPPAKIIDISSQRPRQRLGTMAITPGRDIEVPHDGDDGETGTVPVDAPLRHIALMRRAELVVKYVPGDAHDVDGFHYGGVFVTDEHVDDAYAESEPPTHDDWSPSSMETGSNKTFVNVGLRRIGEEVRAYAHPERKGDSASGAGPGLGAFAESLADLLPGDEGEATGGSTDGSGGGSGGSGGGGRPSRPRIRTVNNPSLTSIQNEVLLKVDFELVPGGDADRVEVRAVASAAVDESGAREAEAPEGAETPRVIRWEDATGRILSENDSLETDVVGGVISVYASVIDSSAVRVDLNLVEVE